MAYFGYSDTELDGGGPIPGQRKPAMALGLEHESRFMGRRQLTKRPLPTG